jgi:putative transposase
MQEFNTRKPSRHKYFNYSDVGYYFVTICTKGHLPYFGNITDNKMILNDCGKIADNCWLEIPKRNPDIQINDYIIMPNHIHGIIIVGDSKRLAFSKILKATKSCPENKTPLQHICPDKNTVGYRHAYTNVNDERNRCDGDERNRCDGDERNRHLGIEWKRHAFSLQERQHQTVPVIVGSFKSAVSKLVHHNILPSFQWQRSYYDRIIRNEKEYNKISHYITENPMNWDKDENNLGKEFEF